MLNPRPPNPQMIQKISNSSIQTKSHDTEDMEPNEESTTSCWNKLRQSQGLVLIVVTIAIALDMMLYSTVLPILPAMLAGMTGQCPASMLGTTSFNVNSQNVTPEALGNRPNIATNRTVARFGKKSAPLETLTHRLNITADRKSYFENERTVNSTSSQSQSKIMQSETLTNRAKTANLTSSYFDNKNTPSGFSDWNYKKTVKQQNLTQRGSSMDNETHVAYSISLESMCGLTTAAKPAAEMISNVIAGFLVDKYDERVIMVAGFVLTSAVTLAFAFARDIVVLVSARIGQAVTSSMTLVAGFALIASTFPTGNERSQAMAVVYAGVSIGPLVGYQLGSLYEVTGQQAPFLILAALSLLDGLLRVMVRSPKKAEQYYEMKRKGGTISTFIRLLRDPYLIAIFVGSFTCDACIGILTSSSTLWVIKHFNTTQWQIGLLLSVTQIAQLISLKIGATVGQMYGQWKVFFIGLWMIAVSFITYPFSRTIWETLGPHSLFRIGVGFMLSVTSSMLSDVADLRHQSRYGPVFGLKSACFNLGLTVGAILGGYINFDILYRVAGVVCMLTSFSACAVRNPKPTPMKEYDEEIAGESYNSASK
jgi:MFS family permease